jgi:hypothetical protein
MSLSIKFKLLGGASALALAVAIGGVAPASAATFRHFAPEVGSHGAATTSVYVGDPLIELTVRSGGRLTAESVAVIIPTLVAPLTAESASNLPAFMEGIRGLGVAPEVEFAALRTLTGLIADATGSTLDEENAARLVTEIAERFPVKVQLAAVQNNPGTGKASDQGKSKNHNNGRGNGTYSG